MNLQSDLYSHSLSISPDKPTSYAWTVPHLSPFNELLISWNAHRPLTGQYVILSRIFVGKQWSPWLLYAVWGKDEQFSFHEISSNFPVRSFQDQVELLDNQVATGFAIRIEACKGASLNNFFHLYVSASKLTPLSSTWSPPQHASAPLAIPKTSQFSYSHPRSNSFCSATSTTAVIHYLRGLHFQTSLCPLQFAQKAYDSAFDIYGNWSLNVAQAFVELNYEWRCFCARMKNIKWLWHSLEKGIPVVISIKGTLPNAPLPYESGHLIVIQGYDANTHSFLCMDPAFPTHEQTEVAYAWNDLMQAWGKRYFLGYFFAQNLQNFR